MKTIARAVPAAQSLGRFLRGEMGLSHHQVSSLKPLNAILVNGVPRHTNYYLSPGDVVEVRLKGGPAAARPCEGPVHIVYEDSDLFIIDKSAPLPTLSSVHQDGDTLEGRMARLYPDTPFRPVNRLDKGTSGLMCAARHAHAQYALSALLHTDKFQREYLAVVEGVPSPLSGVIDAPIGKAEGSAVKREVRQGGQKSVTEYETVKSAGGLSLVRLRLFTGRTHQIRVHMAHIGCPVFGDFLYGRESSRLPGRFALHSWRITMEHPATGEMMTFESPLPEDIQRLI